MRMRLKRRHTGFLTKRSSMNQTLERLDRLIANLRDDQQELMEMYDTIEMEINQLEKEADRLEATLNDNVSVCNDGLTFTP